MGGIRGGKGTIRGGMGRADHEFLRSRFRFVDAILAVACVRGHFGFALSGIRADRRRRKLRDPHSRRGHEAVTEGRTRDHVEQHRRRLGLFLVANIVINLHRPDLLLPSMALVVGLHFLPIALIAGFRPYFVLGMAPIAAAIMGFFVGAPTGGRLTGFMAAGALWLASGIAVRRDWLAKRRTVATV